MDDASVEYRHRAKIVDIGKRLYDKGLVVAGDGNLSVRVGPNKILATPTGVCKGFLKPWELPVIDMSGRVLYGDIPPSSEIAMHLLIYRIRADISAIVHAHPPIATGFSAACTALDKPLIAETVVTMGSVPLAQYATPGTREVPDSIAQLVPNHDAILLANHGAVTYNKNLETAYWKMETVEHLAKITLVTSMLGKESPISAENIGKLLETVRLRG